MPETQLIYSSSLPALVYKLIDLEQRGWHIKNYWRYTTWFYLTTHYILLEKKLTDEPKARLDIIVGPITSRLKPSPPPIKPKLGLTIGPVSNREVKHAHSDRHSESHA